MSSTWFTSDLHFGHRLVAGHRGFFKDDAPDTEAHDEHIVSVWNSLVKPQDRVWILGDMSMRGPKAFGPYVERLNGTLFLISGNHDEVHPMFRDSYKKQRAWLNYFESVQSAARIRVNNGREVLLSHFPYTGEGARTGPDRHTQWRLRDEGTPLVHGHTHDSQQGLSFSEEGTAMLHVGWDKWNAPVSQRDLTLALDTLG